MPDPDDNRCSNCGAENQPDARFCRRCGKPLGDQQPALVAAASTQAAGALNAEITSITDPLLRVVGSASSSDLIITSLGRVLAEVGPRQAEVLRRCAIPRWFDLDVLAVLREREDGNARILELLRGYSFVRQLAEGRYSYHDVVRDALLKEWRERRPDDLRTINLRLADHFGVRVTTTTQGMRALPKGPTSGTISVMPTGEWELWAREALYHRLMADPQDGMNQLHTLFDQVESAHRLADAEALLQVTRDVPLDETGQLWVRYLRARLDRAALRLDEAAEQIDDILSQPVLDPPLAAEARQTLGDIYAETGQWARAIELYRDSLGYFEATGKPYQAAEAMLRLGEAYQGVGFNTGGWNVPAYPQSHFWRSMGQAWNWLLSLPFILVAAFLRRTPWTLPRPEHLTSYQNWLLVRLYRTAQGWYERARNAFKELGDDRGMLRTEQHLAEILLIFGYKDDALAQLNRLRGRPAARDPYTLLWIDCGRAAALLARGETTAAQALLAQALPHFREVGDVRREAAVLALQARAADESGATEVALEGYRSSLARFRALRYTAAREQALYALRAWRRRVGPGPLSERIGALLAEEPEKRYVARFPRSQLPLLQILSLVAFPLALLLLAIFLPDQIVRPDAGSQLPELLTSYDPWRALVLLIGLVLLYSAIYTHVALAVIFFIPMRALEREQPDYLITGADGIARYDYRGALAERIRWEEIRRWIRVDRRLWVRPMSLFSATYLEAADGRDLCIDGITGWYTSVQDDIERHLRAVGNQTQSEDLGFAILRGKNTLMLALGVPLLLLFLAAESGWADWLILLLPPEIYAVCSFVVFSGALFLIPLAYWLATRPLAVQRALERPTHWPQIIGAVGGGAILLYILSGETFQESRSLYIGLLFWGVYVVANVIVTLLLPRNRLAGMIIIVVAITITAGMAFSRARTIYYTTIGKVAGRRALLVGAPTAGAPPPAVPNAQQAIDAANVILEQPQVSPEEKAQAAQAYLSKGKAYYAADQYRDAAQAYNEALRLYGELPPEKSNELRQAIAVALAGRARSLQKLGRGQDWVQDLQQACKIDRSVAAECPER